MSVAGLWDVGDVAAYLKVTKSWVYEHVGDLPGWKMGKYWRFDPDDIREWVRSADDASDDAGCR